MFEKYASKHLVVTCGILLCVSVLACLALRLGAVLLITLALLAVADKVKHLLIRQTNWSVRCIALVCVLVALLMLAAFICLASMMVHFIANHGQAFLPEFFEQLRKAARSTSIEALRPLAEIGDAQLIDYARKWAMGQLSLWMSVTGNSLRFLGHIFFAGLIAISAIMITPSPRKNPGGLADGLAYEGNRFLKCFSHLLTAQLYVALWNTTCTVMYVFVVLPALGINIPLREALVVTTFVMSFIPALGNILANTVMVVLCLQYPPWVLVLSMIYLIAIHKMEYLINAKILSSAYQACVAELLICIVVGETLFGLTGLILTPVLYLYLKDFLDRQGVL